MPHPSDLDHQRHPAGPSDGTELDEELTARLRAAVARLHRRLRQEALGGLSPAQASLLASVNRLGSPSLGELAVAEQVQPPTMTRLAAGLEAAGLVVRWPDPADRRIARVRLTAQGRQALLGIRQLKNAFLARRLADLDPVDQAAVPELVALLEHLVAEP